MGLFDALLGKKKTSREPQSNVLIPPPSMASGDADRPRRKIIDARDESKLPPEAVLLGGQGRVDVSGESYRQEAFDKICGGKCAEGHGRRVYAVLQPEPENPYDPNAIAVYVDEMQVGYMAKDTAVDYAPIAKLLSEKGKIGVARAYIRGGWLRPGGNEGHYSIELELSSTEELLKTRKITSLSSSPRGLDSL